jgi:KUP system potassium uptake protein
LFSLVRNLKKGWLYLIAIIGAAALIADGVITPSLTVMSAIEGLEIYNPHTPVVPITIGILIAIFVVQQFGTSFIGKFFRSGNGGLVLGIGRSWSNAFKRKF